MLKIMRSVGYFYPRALSFTFRENREMENEQGANISIPLR